MKVYSLLMSNATPLTNPLRRILTSLAAIAAVSVIFGAKALESQRAVDATPQVAMTGQLIN